ncbi:TetR/AcrR family transcriptional regulator [Marinomonas flavescens]|uniref:TetR/AcrR family transcriptional regulator n=1 Tax=Marinomonas flavescens TaxID=2529379 RepID=UPI0010554D71|nr:TetR family transcriptional regulator C-terminal domain-containing protein [Marinomonas flavescens]
MTSKRREGNNRRQELVNATLECIANEGLQGATVRRVSECAGVTNGLIRFYFSGKNELIRAAYSALLNHIYTTARIGIDNELLSAKRRLRNFIEATLSPPIVAPRTVLLWANFLPLTYSDPEMAIIRRKAYVDTTDVLATLIEQSFKEDNREFSATDIENFSIKANALIDGLWLDGSMYSEKFQDGALVKIGLEAVSSVLRLELIDIQK